MDLKYSIKYLKYKLFAPHYKGHGIHSPFIYDFIKNVLFTTTKKENFENIENFRKKLLSDNKTITVKDLGAGSKLFKSDDRKIKKIARHSLSSKKESRLLYKIIKYYNLRNNIELGTSLGINSLYMAAANKDSFLYTIEGCPNISNIASSIFKNSNIKNIKQLTGSFEDKLKIVIEQVQKPGLIYFDGNHKKQPTLDYFNICIKYALPESVFIFDDIHWSEEMEEAWETIKNDVRVKVSIDIFSMGIVFFNPDLTKENFVVRV